MKDNSIVKYHVWEKDFEHKTPLNKLSHVKCFGYLNKNIKYNIKYYNTWISALFTYIAFCLIVNFFHIPVKYSDLIRQYMLIRIQI